MVRKSILQIPGGKVGRGPGGSRAETLRRGRRARSLSVLQVARTRE